MGWSSAPHSEDHAARHGDGGADEVTIVEAQISDLDHDDADAIHGNVAGEIAAVTEKATPVSADLLLIEDSAAGNAKKRVQIGNLPGGSSALDDLTDVAITAPTTGEVLKYDGSGWVNDTDDTGSGSLPTASTKGDIAVYNGSAWVVVSAGANDTVLTADSAETAGVKWATPSGGGGGSPDWAYDKTDNSDATDVQWDGTVAATMTTVTITGSQTLTEKSGVLSVKYSGQGSQDYNVLLKPHTFTVGDSFAVAIRQFGKVGVAVAGVIFTDGVLDTSNAVAAHLQKHSNENHTRTHTRHGTLAAMATASAVFNWQFMTVPWAWLRLTYVAANTFRKELSADGISWTTADIADVTKTMTPTHVGVCWSSENTAGDGIATFGPIVKLA